MKLTSSGDTLWTRFYDCGAKEESGNSVRQTPDGGYIVVGVKDYSRIAKSGSIWLLKTDSLGDTLWTRTHGNGGYYQDRGDCIQLTSDGSFIITGFTGSFSPETETSVLLMKTDSQGLLDGIEEGSSSRSTGHWELSNSLGREIALKFSNSLCGFHAIVYDAVGRKVDELRAPQSCGTIRWGESEKPGVYFIVTCENVSKVRKAVLVK